MGEKTKTMTSDLKPEYGKETYWDERYKKFFTEDVDFDALLDGSLEEESPFFDWYRDWDQLGDKLKRYIEPGHSIMMLGCGNSAMSHEIYDGVPCHNILKVDVTKQLDVLGGEIDSVIDKGCFDAIFCGQNSADAATKALLNVAKALKSGGVYIVISHAASEFRLAYFDDPELGWSEIKHDAL